MGAGISKAQEYRIIYRELHRIQRELSTANVKSDYKNRYLSHVPALGCETFSVTYRRQTASNGECCLYPEIVLLDAAGEWASYSGLSQDSRSYKAGIARIIDLFAGKETWYSTRAAK